MSVSFHSGSHVPLTLNLRLRTRTVLKPDSVADRTSELACHLLANTLRYTHRCDTTWLRASDDAVSAVAILK
jgi:hypothetical protein